ncbi:MAG TPA: glycosyltransferase family 2 protein [Patescibacteria group bacterium]|nr:glycosyltransferase family 2 protein [Patescibacteria group bacterium]
MKISLVIPVYNEVDTLNECLKAISNQTKKPYEVIVVDNNSTDGSSVIANRYPLVKVINEKKQGVVHARTTGFNLAKGEIVARIDADSILPKTWIETVQDIFDSNEVAAISGSANYYGVSFANIFNKIDLYFRKSLSRKLKDNLFLWGSNMAVRKDAWEDIKEYLCYTNGLHEDYDLAIHLQKFGYKVDFKSELVAAVSPRRIDNDYIKFMKYVWRCPNTYRKHNIKSIRKMMPIILTCGVFYLPGRILYRGYDKDKNEFSIYKLFTSQSLRRVDPTTNVV